MKTINGIKEDFDVKVIPVSVDSPSFKTHDPTAPDAAFLNRIKDKKLSNFVDGTKCNSLYELSIYQNFKWTRLPMLLMRL